MTQYCIPERTTQQCATCRLVNGKLYIGNYEFPNCPGTQWVQIKSWPGTNSTPVYEVVAMPLDSIIFMALFAMVLIFGATKLLRTF